MLENILKLDGVVALTKEQQKKVKGGGRRNCNETGRHKYIYSGGELVSEACEWVCAKRFLGIKIGEHPPRWSGCSGNVEYTTEFAE